MDLKARVDRSLLFSVVIIIIIIIIIILASNESYARIPSRVRAVIRAVLESCGE